MSESLPDVAEHFAADARAFRVAARHDATRRGEDARTKTAHHLGHLVASEIDAAAGTAHALEAGNDVLAAGAVLQRDADGGTGRIGTVDHLHVADVAFLL